METFHEEVRMPTDHGSTVVVFGSINADTCYRVQNLPLPGETVVAETAVASPGGKGANQAIAAAAAGSPTRMIGMVGSDAEAEPLLHALADRGVETSGIERHATAPTGRALVLVDEAGENSIVVLPGANGRLDAEFASQTVAVVEPGDVLVLQNEVPAAANRAAARLAREAGANVVWNAAPAPAGPDEIVHDIDLLVVNESELVRLAALLGIRHDSSTDPDAMSRLLAATLAALRREGDAGISGVCTLGADGAVFVSGDSAGHVPALRVTAVDTTAAGDTVVGYLAAHHGMPLRDRLELAGAAGALAVTREGASTSIPSLPDVRRALASTPERTTE